MTNSTMPMLIHIGLITHHHDQLIILHSLRTMKAIVSKPVKPMPLDDVFESLILFKFKIQLQINAAGPVKMAL